MGIRDRLVECPECEGSGYYYVGPMCTMPASMCCGGCYDEVFCKECDGKGEIYQEIEEEYEDD